MKNPSHVPDGWPALIPRIVASNPEALVAFVTQVFGASGSFNAERPSELRIGDSMLMISGATERELAPAFLYIYVEDTDLSHRRALEGGATSIEEPRDLPYGDRRAMVQDGWGNTGQIATHGGTFTP
jgi:PhnB protein